MRRAAGPLGAGIVGLVLFGGVVVAPGPAPGLAADAPAPAAPPAPPAAPAAATFPATWRGAWTGPCRLVGGAGTTMTFTMGLVVEPTSDAARWTWTVVYDGAAGRQVRPYTLVAKDPAQGAWAVDEGNSIVLPMTWLDGGLWGMFSVGGTRITARYRREGEGTSDERIEVELLTTADDAGVATGGAPGAPSVRGWAPRSLQTATLRRAPK